MTEWDDEPGGCATPEDAARGDIPERYARVVKVNFSADGGAADVELLTNEEPYGYPYYVHCSRDARGLWHEDYGHN